MTERDIPLRDRLVYFGKVNGKAYFRDKYFPDEWYYYDYREYKFTRCTFDNFKDKEDLFKL